MIEVSHLKKVYGPRTAVDDLTFEVKKGEVVGFLGPNGAGKSTTMKIITGFMPATEGKVRVAGFDVFEKPIEVKKNIGFLPENPPVYLEMQVRDYIEYVARLHDVSANKVKSLSSVAIEKTGLGEVRNRIIGNLSKGYRQRVGLAQALVHNPQVLILDEPTVGLDPVQIVEIREVIKALGGEHTVILSSHILPEVTATCQRIIVINKGKIIAQDTIEHIETRLQKGSVYHLDVKSISDAGVQAIRSISGIGLVNVVGSRMTIQIPEQSSEIRDQIVERAVQNKMGVLEFASEKMSLEEIFLQLTTKE